MKNGIKRIGKGLFAIFMIKLTLLIGVLAFQACQTESNFENESLQEAKSNFLTALQESNQKLQQIIITPSDRKGEIKGNDLIKENTHEINTFKMCLLLNQDDNTDTSDTNGVDTSDVNTIGEVVDLGNETGTRPVIVDSITNEPIDGSNNDFGATYCFDIPIEPTVESMEASLMEAKNYLYANQFNDNDIEEILDGENESNLIPLVMALIAEEEQTNNSNLSINYLTLFGEGSYAQGEGPNVYDCTLRALGITALTDAFTNGLNSKLGKKALKKAIKKIALRTLGWVGAAWAAYEFGGCMNWW